MRKYLNNGHEQRKRVSQSLLEDFPVASSLSLIYYIVRPQAFVITNTLRTHKISENTGPPGVNCKKFTGPQ